MKATKRETPICVNCSKNSADSPNFEVKCYWKKHENLDVGNTCKYFNRGSNVAVVPVNECFALEMVSDILVIIPNYVFSLTDDDEGNRHIQPGPWVSRFGNNNKTHHYDANIDLIISESPPTRTLKDFVDENTKITELFGVTDGVAHRYPAMMDARRIIEQRTKKKAA